MSEILDNFDLFEWALESGVLDERECIVIADRFGPNPKTLAQVADRLGLKTRERVRQIQNIALSKLRRRFQQEWATEGEE